MSGVIIPTLGEVPGWPHGKPFSTVNAEDVQRWRTISDDWFRWRDSTEKFRTKLHGRCAHDLKAQAVEKALVSQDVGRFIALWLSIHEPRPRKGESPIKPFTPFAFQVELAQTWAALIDDPEPADDFTSKCRGLGASWIFCAVAVWGYLFKGWNGLFVSRNADVVDRYGDIGSLFGKVDFILKHLPPWFLPDGWRSDVHRRSMLLTHPDGITQLAGEATTSKTGRATRATYAMVDEAAFIPPLLDLFATLSGTTDHRILISTESFDNGTQWYDLWREAKERTPERVHELEWWENPYQSPEWLAGKREGSLHDVAKFEREYLRNPWADRSSFIYPMVMDCDVDERHAYDPAAMTLVGIDPGRADDTAIVFAQPLTGDAAEGVRFIDSYERNLMPAEWYAHILTGIWPEPGDVCWGYEFSPRDEQIMAFTAQLPWGHDRIRFFMDPSGANKDMSGQSFHERLMLASKKLRERHVERAGDERRPVPILPLYQELFARNRHDVRRLAMRQLLAHSVFTKNEGAIRLRDALRHYRFAEPGPKATGQPAPIHDEHSHLVSASEYLAVYASLGLGRPPVEKPADPKKIIIRRR